MTASEHLNARRRVTVKNYAGSVHANSVVVGDSSYVLDSHIGAPRIYGSLRTGGIPYTVSLGCHTLPAVVLRTDTTYWDSEGVQQSADADHERPERRLPQAAAFLMDTASSIVDRVDVNGSMPSFEVRRIVADYATLVRFQLLAEDVDGTLEGQRARVAFFRNDAPLIVSHRIDAAASVAGAPADSAGVLDVSTHAAPFVEIVWRSRNNARGERLSTVEADVEIGFVPAADAVDPAVPDAVMADMFIATATADNENLFRPGDHLSILLMSLADRQVSFQGVASFVTMGVRPTQDTSEPASHSDFYPEEQLDDRPRFRFE